MSKSKKWVKHIVKEGSSQHVIYWDNHGRHCLNKNCEINEEEPPLTCADCGEPLSDDEVTDYYNDIEDDDDKPYCFGCIGKMRVAEYTGDEE